MNEIDNKVEVLTDQLNAVQRQMDDLAEYLRPYTDRMNELEEIYAQLIAQIDYLTEEKELIEKGLIRITCPACRGNGSLDLQFEPMQGYPGFNFDMKNFQCPNCKGRKYLIAKKYGGN